MTGAKKTRARGDKQLRADERFDTARAVNENAAALKASNRSSYVLTPEDETKIKRYPTPPDRFAPTGEVPRVVSASEARPWTAAVTE